MKFILPAIFLFLGFCYQAQTDEKSKKQGYIRKKDERTNRVIYEGMFKDDQPVGLFKYYYPNDSIKALLDFKSGGSAYARLFHPNGKRMGEGKYINKDVKDSTWTFYDESGTLLSREEYKVGRKNGASFVYLPDGKLAEERNYKGDVPNGPFRQYFGNSAVKSAGNYLNGQLDGKVSYFYPNGIEVAAGYYRNGQKTGPWIYKNEDGKIKDRELYRNGVLASPKETEDFFNKNKQAGKPAADKKPVQKKAR
jgi:antitoxin component YwqK of YwqJK toxin-antitoxin module